jgi:arylsulfatase A-like enzyme
VLAGLALAAACGRSHLPTELSLRDAIARHRYGVGSAPATGLVFPHPPALVAVSFDGETRRAVVTSTDPFTWTGKPDRGSVFHAGVQVAPAAGPPHSVRAWVEAEAAGEREVLDVVDSAASGTAAPRWLELDADLSRFAGRRTTLTFHAEVAGDSPAAGAGRVAWAPVRVSAWRARPRPNVIFVLVDTLRHDHLTPYGYRRDTSPNIARLLAQRGTVVEEAYSQAPWTLPSVVSFLTSRYPGEVLGSDSASFGIPPSSPALPEEMAKLGYETGGFLANKVLHAGNGFARGYSTFFSPVADTPGDQGVDAAVLVDHLQPWLAAHRNASFFLYAHFIDPHDPYVNPEIVDGRSPFFPDYHGQRSGWDIQGLHTGKIALADANADVAQINALYDSEVHYVDRFLGTLLDGLPESVLRNTLVVLTADHGEELYDHGGWKHGFTLYEDQIHVPLLVRWDGRIPAGARLPGVVRLLDLAPTLLRAAGGTPPAAWEGVDLLPALTHRAPLPRLTAFAQHMMIGPLRAAAVQGREKLILFNAQTPFTPSDDFQAHLWSLDLARMRRVELYDLAHDTGERRNLAASGEAAGAAGDGAAGAGSAASRRREAEAAVSPAAASRIAALAPAIHRQLDRQLPGLRVILAGFPAGARVRGTILLAAAPPAWQSYFLAAGDRIEVSGREVRFDLAGETVDKGFLLPGEGITIERIEASLDGAPLPGDRIRVGRGAAYRGGRLATAALLAEGWPERPAGGGLAIWLPRGPRGLPALGRNAETEKRLRALGYIR